jgi:hypothetical protein
MDLRKNRREMSTRFCFVLSRFALLERKAR